MSTGGAPRARARRRARARHEHKAQKHKALSIERSGVSAAVGRVGSARRPAESEGVEGRRAGCSRRCRRPCGSPRAHPAVPPHYPMQYRVAAHGPTLHRPSHSPQGPRKSIGLSKGVNLRVGTRLLMNYRRGVCQPGAVGMCASATEPASHWLDAQVLPASPVSHLAGGGGCQWHIPLGRFPIHWQPGCPGDSS